MEGAIKSTAERIAVLQAAIATKLKRVELIGLSLIEEQQKLAELHSEYQELVNKDLIG